jgi:predicted lipoprotein with Yx(FWY)xxD motif
MRLSIRDFLTVAHAVDAAGLVLATCGGGDGDDNGNATAADAGVADSEGRTLDSAEVERGGQIGCIDACTSFWEPVNASANEAESASADRDLDLGVVDRSDGDLQLTFDGLPLYSFTEEGPGQLDGDGLVDDFEGIHFEWAAATTSGGSGSAGSNSPC